MSKELTVLIIGFLGLFANFLCLGTTIQNQHNSDAQTLVLFFAFEIQLSLSAFS
jgi:hypothetical protein